MVLLRVYKYPELPLTPLHSASAKEQKQILADINAGSQKFGRKLLVKPGHKRGKSNETITPVTVLSPEPEQQQEDRRGRKSTSSQRPGIPKRTSSMRRAYNYFFGGSSSGTPAQPPSPTSPVTPENVTSPKEEDKNVSRDAGVDTPPQTPARDTAAAESEEDAKPEPEPAGM